MSDYDFSSSLSSFGSGSYGAGSSSGTNGAQKQQVMDQVRNQVAVAQAQELLQVCGVLCMCVLAFFTGEDGKLWRVSIS